MIFFKLILTNLLRHRIRSLISIAGIAFGVAAMLTIVTILQGAVGMFSGILSSDSQIIVFERNVSDLFFSNVPASALAEISTWPMVQHADPVLFGVVTSTDHPIITCFGITADDARLRKATWVVGGWFGSAMGIGMGQNLGHIPPLFVLFAAALILLPMLLQCHRRELLATVALLLIAAAAWATQKSFTPMPPPLTQAERGRQVYIAEGCINCHSQYVRPNTPDVLLWGPVQTLADLRAQRPPLIGNRRQGPDLSNVALRRSPLWLRAHFYAPSQISHGSIMPTFAPLFRTQPGTESKGDELIAYLETLHPAPTAAAEHRTAELSYQPNFTPATASHGQRLYAQECATCHEANGATRLEWRTSFHRLPTDLSTRPYVELHPTTTPAQLAQIIKFGIPNTDMAGHEYLSDADVASLTLYLQQILTKPQPTATNAHYGDPR